MVPVKAMFILTACEIFLFNGRSVSTPAGWVQGAKKLNF